ncbi:hypothetical protein LB505_009577 [Fusarium chuoi]|nr:hypothetical protein LB505_009577 [Fusarium chuoi]
MTDHGMMTVLNPKYTDELRNIPQLNHARAIAKSLPRRQTVQRSRASPYHHHLHSLTHNDSWQVKRMASCSPSHSPEISASHSRTAAICQGCASAHRRTRQGARSYESERRLNSVR